MYASVVSIHCRIRAFWLSTTLSIERCGKQVAAAGFLSSDKLLVCHRVRFGDVSVRRAVLIGRNSQRIRRAKLEIVLHINSPSLLTITLHGTIDMVSDAARDYNCYKDAH
uniref:KH_dom_type_1 domain-containing protein n=1 Tax=Steinernema glaseri TaxID=37863 RepID=A0A1I7ZDM8_9BILA